MANEPILSAPEAHKPPAAEPEIEDLISSLISTCITFACAEEDSEKEIAADKDIDKLRSDLSVLFRKLAASTAPGWIALFAERPETGKWCWVIIGKTVQHVPAKLNDDEDDNPVWEWMNEGDEAPFNVVTHWQPLAAPPAPHF